MHDFIEIKINKYKDTESIYFICKICDLIKYNAHDVSYYNAKESYNETANDITCEQYIKRVNTVKSKLADIGHSIQFCVPDFKCSKCLNKFQYFAGEYSLCGNFHTLYTCDEAIMKAALE